MEREFGMKPGELKKLKHFIDEEIIIIMRQMDSASMILDHLYLGSEWNASNLEELKRNGYVCTVCYVKSVLLTHMVLTRLSQQGKNLEILEFQPDCLKLSKSL